MAPAIIDLLLPNDRASVSRVNVPRLVKIHDATVQCDIQSFARDGKLDHIGVFSLIPRPFSGPILLTDVTAFAMVAAMQDLSDG
jgi:hypothetical protein